MGKARKFRQLRKIAKAMETEPYKTVNENINVKSVKSSNMVLNSEGIFVQQEVPKVVFNTEMVDGCARKIYKDLKKEV